MAKKKPDEPTEVEETPKARPIDFKWLPVDQIVCNDWNPNSEDELTFNLLKDEINEVGFIDPIEVVPLNDGTFRILGGEHRWRAAKDLGHEEVPCVLLTDSKWESIDLQKFVTVRLNVLKGKIDAEKFLNMYKELSEKYGEESMQKLMGYANPREFQKLLGWVKKGLKQSLPKEMAAQVESSTKEVKTVADLENIVQDLFNKYGETVNNSFMVFTYGKATHIYIQATAKTRRAVERLMTFCNTAKKDINEVLEPMLTEGIKPLVLKFEKESRESSNKSSDYVLKEEDF